MKQYKILGFALAMLGFVVFQVQAATQTQLSIHPLYSDERFPPTDKLHAGCMHHADIKLSTEYDVREVNVLMEYDPDKIDIFRIIPDSKNKEEKIKYEIRDGEILFNHSNIVYIPWYEIELFSIMFSSSKDVETLDIIFATGSYIVTRDEQKIPIQGKQKVEFVSVPECEPDIVPPSIKMIKPIQTETGVALDSLFAFEIKDNGKGVDWANVYITIGEDVYTINSAGVGHSGNTLIIQPRSWLPLGSLVPITVKAADKQKYGGSNTIEKTFDILTAGDIQLDSNLTPAQLSRRVSEIRAKRGNTQECSTLQSLSSFINPEGQQMLSSIFDKLDCEIVFAEVEAQGGDVQRLRDTSPAFVISASSKGVSVFSITGWILFILTLILKLNYFIAYKKQNRKK